jgi:hypothetical protein
MKKILICIACTVVYATALYLINAPVHTIEVVSVKAPAIATTTAPRTMPSKVVAITKKPLAYTSRPSSERKGPSREVDVRKYFADVPVLAEISHCESRFIQTKYDGTVLQGEVDPRDTGVMQINTGFHGDEAKKLGLDLTKFEDNMAFARYLYNEQGTTPWDASAKCWDI